MNTAPAALRTRSESAFAVSGNRHGASAPAGATGSVLGSTHDRAVIAVAPTPAVTARPGTKQDRPPRGAPH